FHGDLLDESFVLAANVSEIVGQPLGDVCVRSQNGVVRCGADPITSHPEAMRLFEHRGTACLVTTSGDELCRDSEWISHGEYDGSFEAAPDGYRWWCEFEESLVRCWGRNAFEA